MRCFMQHAWLEFDTGFWLLRTDSQSKGKGVVRTWVDKTAALVELADEGWTVNRQYSRRRRSQTEAKLKFKGYALSRTVQ